MNLKLAEKIDSLKQKSIEELSKKFNCLPEEICVGDYIARYTDDKVCPYKVILGFANFEGSDVTSLGNLEIVYGKKLEDRTGPLLDVNGNQSYLGINLVDSKIRSLGNLQQVYGSITLNEDIKSLENVKFLGSNLFLGRTNLQDLGNLEVVDGMLNFERTSIRTLGKLKKVRKLRIASQSLKSLGDLEWAKEIINATNPRYRIDRLIDETLIFDGRKYSRIFEDVTTVES